MTVGISHFVFVFWEYKYTNICILGIQISDSIVVKSTDFGVGLKQFHHLLSHVGQCI